MDPLTIIGGVASAAQIAAGIVQTLKSLNDARGRFDNAETTVKLLVAELLAVKAAVGQIEDWAKYNFTDRPMPKELVEAFQVSFDGCKLAMEILADEVAAIVSRNPFLTKAKVAWNEATMKEHADRLRSQVAAMQLLIQAVRCHDGFQQTVLLEKPSSRRIIQQVTDDTSTLRASKRKSQFSKLGSGPPTIISHCDSTIGSTIFDMDQELVNTVPYQRAKEHQESRLLETQSKNPFVKRSTSDIIGRVESPKRTPILSTTNLTQDSRVDSGFYDEDADIVNPAKYREAVASVRAEHNRHITRSVSEPQSRQTVEPSTTKTSQGNDQLTPMERFQADRHKLQPPMLDPIESHIPLHSKGHHHSASDSNAYQSLASVNAGDVKKSPWGTLKRLTSRASLPKSSSNLTLSPRGAFNGSLRFSPKSVKRKSESNIHQSIDFTTEDGLSAPEIVRAAQSGSRMEIERLLEQRVDIEEKHQRSGRTALSVASHCGNDSVVAVLLHHQAQVEVRDASGMAPLHLAANRGHYRTVQYLLNDHANVDVLGPENKTPLRFACDGGHLDCVELLLERRAKVNARDQHMFTALHAAAKIGDVQIVELLIQNGADSGAKDANLMTAIHYAAEGDYDDVVEKLLFYKADLESLGAHSKTPLSCACASGAHQTASLLIAMRANPRHKADGDMTPLHFACFHDRADTADLLLKQKRISIDARNSDGRTPLHLAVISRSFSAAELLLRKGADAEAQCNRTLRPVHYSCDNTDQIMIHLLLGCGASIEARTQRGWRPIHFAAFRGSEAATDTLATKGAKIDVRDVAGERALCIACARGHLGVVKTLLKCGSVMQLRVPKGPSLEDSPLCRAARYGHANVVNELISYGASVRQRDEANWNPLRYAAYYGHADVVQALIKAGARIIELGGGLGSSAELRATSATQFSFADEVDPAMRWTVKQMLKEAEEKERTQGRRLGEHDPFLMELPLQDRREQGVEPVRIYEIG
jgi:ankyrin repeat protein